MRDAIQPQERTPDLHAEHAPAAPRNRPNRPAAEHPVTHGDHASGYPTVVPSAASRAPAAERAYKQTLIRPWASQLERAIATEVLPRMLAQHALDPAAAPTEADIERVLALIVADHAMAAQHVVEEMAARGMRRDTILQGLLAQVARRLGEMWEEDRCDFAVVTLAMIRLNQIMRDTAAPLSDAPLLRGHERHLLIASAPGEQHSFGVAVIADLFARAGWIVQSEPVMTRIALMRAVRRNWFDVVGLSVSADKVLKTLPAVIRALRRTALNPKVGVMVGGKVFVEHPERAQFVGADATARDGQEALFEADELFERTHAAPA